MSGIVDFIVRHRAEVLQRLLEHVEISALSLMIALLLALPLALWLAHSGRGSFLAINAANVGRALPSLALIALALPWGGLRPRTAIFALVLLGVPPIITNAYVGVREVDRDVVEAARGMGMRAMQVLGRAELPLAAPVIMAGIRTASVQIIATATLGALVASGGLGAFITDGLAVGDTASILTGALLVAVLAVAADAGFGALERAVTPTGVRLERGRGAVEAAPVVDPGTEDHVEAGMGADAR
ncbi:MAG TPA: ABC transporter permease [Actinomycetes bacterium]|jgi:osmoprotectant transport system permease protein|nr:ABC transporter permease [Actinomycetes bacterium]